MSLRGTLVSISCGACCGGSRFNAARGSRGVPSASSSSSSSASSSAQDQPALCRKLLVDCPTVGTSPGLSLILFIPLSELSPQVGVPIFQLDDLSLFGC